MKLTHLSIIFIMMTAVTACEMSVVDDEYAELESALVSDSYTIGDLEIRHYSYTSNNAHHPGVNLEVPSSFRILGGGAQVHWSGVGNMLTGAFPVNSQVWRATSKDHVFSDEATVTGYAIAARYANGQRISDDDYIIVEETSVRAAHPSAEVVLPEGFVLVGGGARVNWSGTGNLLFASYPRQNSWVASSKDHGVSSPATITTFAIGLKESLLSENGTEVIQRSMTSGTRTNHPNVSCNLPQGYRLFSGGAHTNWQGVGSLLTASYAQDRHTWRAAGKDHQYEDLSTVTAYCIGASY